MAESEVEAEAALPATSSAMGLKIRDMCTKALTQGAWASHDLRGARMMAM